MRGKGKRRAQILFGTCSQIFRSADREGWAHRKAMFIIAKKRRSMNVDEEPGHHPEWYTMYDDSEPNQTASS